MVNLVGVNSIRAGIVAGKALCKIVNQYFVAAIRLCFEKIFTKYQLIGKKKYCGLHWENPDYADKINTKGLESVRRDNPKFIQKTMKKAQKFITGWDEKHPKIVRRSNIPAAILVVQEIQTAILQNTLPIEEYVTSKTYSKREEDYAGPQEHIEVVKKRARRNPNKPYQLGDRVRYVIVQSHKKAKNFEKAEEPEWVVENNIPLDRTYYIERLKKTFLRIFTPILAPKEMWQRPLGREPPETDKEIEAEKREEKRFNEKNAYPGVSRLIFTGKHTRKIVVVTPKSGGIIDYLQPMSKTSNSN